jgi:hypothetical protein
VPNFVVQTGDPRGDEVAPATIRDELANCMIRGCGPRLADTEAVSSSHALAAAEPRPDTVFDGQQTAGSSHDSAGRYHPSSAGMDGQTMSIRTREWAWGVGVGVGIGKIERARRLSFHDEVSLPLPAFFPPGFLAIVCYPPFIWMLARALAGSCSVAAAWHAHRDRRSTLDGTFRILHIRPAELDSEE